MVVHVKFKRLMVDSPELVYDIFIREGAEIGRR